MADEKDNIFDKAETLARRVFERLGTTLDSKLSPDNADNLSAREVGELIAKMERAIDGNLRPDSKGTKRVAPVFFKVMFTYERALNLNKKYLDSLYNELKTAVFEYITNRRYETQGQIQIALVRDFFEKTTAVKAAHTAKEIAVNATDLLWPKEQGTTSQDKEKRQSGICAVHLRSKDGTSFHFDLKVGGQPVCIGRSAGNRLRIEDASISRVHCSFTLHSDGQILLADLNSSNWTFINSKEVKANEARAIKQGDVITVGDIQLLIVEMV